MKINEKLVQDNKHRLDAFRSVYGTHHAPTVHGNPGEHISKAIERVLEGKEPRILNFNDVELMVTPGVTTLDTLRETFDQVIEDRRRKWEASPEGIQAAAEAAKRVVRMQARVNELTEALPASLETTHQALKWVVEFAQAADYVGVKTDYPKVVSTLLEAGYSATPRSDLTEKDMEDINVFAAQAFAHCISFMQKSMPPHPSLAYMIQNHLDKLEAGTSPAPAPAI